MLFGVELEEGNSDPAGVCKIEDGELAWLFGEALFRPLPCSTVSWSSLFSLFLLSFSCGDARVC